MNFNIKIGAAVPLSGATGRTFDIVPAQGNLKDDEVYRRGVALEAELANKDTRKNQPQRPAETPR